MPYQIEYSSSKSDRIVSELKDLLSQYESTDKYGVVNCSRFGHYAWRKIPIGLITNNGTKMMKTGKYVCWLIVVSAISTESLIAQDTTIVAAQDTSVAHN